MKVFKYRVKFWDGETTDVNAQSLDGLIEHLYKHETKKIDEIMRVNGELSLRQSTSVLLWNNEFSGSLWFNLDTGDVLSHKDKPPCDSTFKCLLPEIAIDQITLQQFHKMIMLMWKELMDDYGGSYLDFYQEKNGEYVDMI